VGVLGLGIGVLARSQTPAVLITVMLYTVGLYGAQGVIAAIQRFVYHHDNVVAWIVLYPGYAAQVAGAISDRVTGSTVPASRWRRGAA
jgi:hypothetical protein